MSAAKPQAIFWDKFEIDTKVTFLNTPADLPELPTLEMFKDLVNTAAKLKRPKAGKTEMAWVMYEGTAEVDSIALAKGRSGLCYETNIPVKITNKIPRQNFIYISQGMAPCAGCIRSYAGWASHVDRPIVVYGEDEHGNIPAQSFVIFSPRTGTFVLPNKLRNTVLGY